MMKSSLLFVFLFPLLLGAQRSNHIRTHDTRSYTFAPSTKQIPDKRAEDVLLPPAADLPCFTAGSDPQRIPDTGFVFGSNLFGDVVVGQRIVNPNAGAFRITAVATAFEFPGEGADDVYLTALVISDPGPDGGEYTFMGESDSIRAGDLRVSQTELLFTSFTFSEPILLNDASFFVAIDFSRAYATDPPPYIGLLSTVPECGDGDNVIIITDDGQSETVDTYKNIYADDAELFFEVTVDDSTTVGIGTPRLANYRVKAFPNPATKFYSLRFEAPQSPSRYSAMLTDLAGRVLLKSEPRAGAGAQLVVDWSVADLAAGLYLYHIDGPEGRQSGKMIKR